jgi:hypothetical protein
MLNSPILRSRASWIGAALALALALPLRAEVSEVRISRQYGLPYLSVVIMEQNRLSDDLVQRFKVA